MIALITSEGDDGIVNDNEDDDDNGDDDDDGDDDDVNEGEIYETLIFEPRMKGLISDRPSQLCTKLEQYRKESLKKESQA